MDLARRLFALIRKMPASVIAFVVTAVLGLVGMGVVAVLLYYPVAPALPSRYPTLEQWSGDWVWPVMLMVGMLWSLGFLFAGVLNQALIRSGRPLWQRRLAYLLVLWLWAWLLWLVMLASQGEFRAA